MDAFETTLANARATLLAERNAAGHWEGELSSSALSTATAVAALSLVDATAHEAFVTKGLTWLATHQNDDGGWGEGLESNAISVYVHQLRRKLGDGFIRTVRGVGSLPRPRRTESRRARA